jgi:hypothetical protein
MEVMGGADLCERAKHTVEHFYSLVNISISRFNSQHLQPLYSSIYKMQITTLTLALLSTAAVVSAHPAPLVRPAVTQEPVSAPYTAGDAYNDCQAKGLGDFVCWANEDAKSYGRMGSSELSMSLSTCMPARKVKSR